MKILIATGNEGKKKEILEAFGEFLEVEFLSLCDFPKIKEPEEHGQTYEENALIKAKYFGEAFGVPAIGEDSGLILEAFPEKFGLRTRREIPANSDEEWLDLFLKILEGEKNRRAIFSSAMAFYHPGKNLEHVVLGQTSGKIATSPQAKLEKGIPVSAIFYPDGMETVYSAMSKHEKNAISHRGESARKMIEFLKNLPF